MNDIIENKIATWKNSYTLAKRMKKHLTFWIPGISTGWIPANPFVSRLLKIVKNIMLNNNFYFLSIKNNTLKLNHFTFY